MQIAASTVPASVPPPAPAPPTPSSLGNGASPSADGSSAGTIATATPSSASGGIVDQVMQLASVLSDSSTASTEDKVNAYINILQLQHTPGSGWFGSSTKADQDSVESVLENSSVGKQIEQASNAFYAQGDALYGSAKTTNINGVLNDAFQKASPLNQLMIYAGSAATTVPSLDSFKTAMATGAAQGAKILAENQAAAKPAVNVTLSDTAKATLATSSTAVPSTPAGASKQALATLATPNPGVSQADVALAMLQNASNAKAKSDAQAKAEDKAAAANPSTSTTPTSNSGFHPLGGTLDTSA